MFEHSLIGLEAKKPSRRAWFSLPAAIGLHVIAVATFTFAGTWNVAAVPEPMIVEPFVVQLPPPPPPILGSGRPETKGRNEVKAPTPPIPPEQPVQPKDTADLDAEAKASSDSPVVDSVASLPPGGDPRGSIYGVEDGDPNSGVDFSDGPIPVAPAPAPAPEMAERSEPIQVGGAVTRPVVVSRTEPRYTELARKARIEGVVIVRAVIDEQGYVTAVRLVRGQPMGLDKAAMDAVKTWRFTAATLHGVPVKVYFNLTVTFSLQR